MVPFPKSYQNPSKIESGKAPEIEAKKEALLYAHIPQCFLGFLKIRSNSFGFPDLPWASLFHSVVGFVYYAFVASPPLLT